MILQKAFRQSFKTMDLFTMTVFTTQTHLKIIKNLYFFTPLLFIDSNCMH